MTVDVRREQLLEAGIPLFAQRSWEEVSIDEIAEACGVSRGLLYHYFRGKRDYYVATIAHAFERLHALQPDQALAPTEQLRVGLERFFESLEQDPDAHAALRRVAPADEEVAQIVERNHQAFAERVLAGMPGAGGGSALARVTARAWLGAVDAAGLDWLERREVPSQALVEILAEALVAAMLAAARIDPTIEIPQHVAAIGHSGIVKQIAEAETTDAAAQQAGPPSQPQRR
jgi:AcrR family transcriptional regulator